MMMMMMMSSIIRLTEGVSFISVEVKSFTCACRCWLTNVLSALMIIVMALQYNIFMV